MRASLPISLFAAAAVSAAGTGPTGQPCGVHIAPLPFGRHRWPARAPTCRQAVDPYGEFLTRRWVGATVCSQKPATGKRSEYRAEPTVLPPPARSKYNKLFTRRCHLPESEGQCWKAPPWAPIEARSLQRTRSYNWRQRCSSAQGMYHRRVHR